MEESQLNDLKDRAKRLVRLLDEWEPGLFSWQGAANQSWFDVVMWAPEALLRISREMQGDDGADKTEKSHLPTQTEVYEWREKHHPSVMGVVWAAAKLCEEAGEVMGVVTKMNDGTNRKTKTDLRREAAQAAICVMAVAEAGGFDLDDAIREEWERMA